MAFNYEDFQASGYNVASRTTTNTDLQGYHPPDKPDLNYAVITNVYGTGVNKHIKIKIGLNSNGWITEVKDAFALLELKEDITNPNKIFATGDFATFNGYNLVKWEIERVVITKTEFESVYFIDRLTWNKIATGVKSATSWTWVQYN